MLVARLCVAPLVIYGWMTPEQHRKVPCGNEREMSGALRSSPVVVLVALAQFVAGGVRA